MNFDLLLCTAAGAFGWGLSLATYRMFALHYGWPMGVIQVNWPAVPVLLGLVSLIVGFASAILNGGEVGGWVVLAGGLVLAIVWTGLLRVASQTSLFLAPAAAGLVILGWTLSSLG